MGQRADAEGEGVSNPTRPAMPIKSRLPDDLDKAYSHALDYAIELEQVWAPKVLAYMDHCEATIKRLRGLLTDIPTETFAEFWQWQDKVAAALTEDT